MEYGFNLEICKDGDGEIYVRFASRHPTLVEAAERFEEMAHLLRQLAASQQMQSRRRDNNQPSS